MVKEGEMKTEISKINGEWKAKGLSPRLEAGASNL